jgi:hypothetical protein
MKFELPPNKNIDKEQTKNTSIFSNIKIPLFLKASIISLGLLNSNHVISQNKQEKEFDNDKNKIELMNEMSSFYKEASSFKEKSLSFVEPGENQVIAEIKNDIIVYDKIAENPEFYYENIIKKIEEIKAELVDHFSSDSFLQKLSENLGQLKAKEKQERILKNLSTVGVVIASPDSIKKQTGGDGVACYSPSLHRVMIPFSEINFEYIEHELLHSAYRAEEELSDHDKKILYKNFTKNDEESKDKNNYLHKPSERIVRKKNLDFEMERLKIKKYEEKFTHEHYIKLKELQKNGEVNTGIGDLLNTTNEKELTNIMNTIAFDQAEKDLNERLA